MTKKIQITKDMTLAEALNYNKNASEIFLGFGMHCFSCPVAQSETLEQAAEVHNIDLEVLLSKLNGK